LIQAMCENCVKRLKKNPDIHFFSLYEIKKVEE